MEIRDKRTEGIKFESNQHGINKLFIKVPPERRFILWTQSNCGLQNARLKYFRIIISRFRPKDRRKNI